MPVPGLFLFVLKPIRGFVSIVRSINPTIIIIIICVYCNQIKCFDNSPIGATDESYDEFIQCCVKAVEGILVHQTVLRGLPYLGGLSLCLNTREICFILVL